MRTVFRHPVVWGLLTGLVLVLVRSVFFGLYHVPTVSMAPTLLRGDWLLVDRWSLRGTPPRRGDIIVFDRNGDSYVKRVLGLPGELIRLHEGVVSVGDSELRTHVIEDVSLDADGAISRSRMGLASHSLVQEEWQGHSWTAAHFRESESETSQFVVPSGHLLVLGDNRAESVDSRQGSLGMVPLESVEGRVSRIMWSRGSSGFRPDRWWRQID